MQLRQLEYFVAICQAGSFTAAAEQLYVAQPSLSQQIRSLEKELGCKLFDRRSSGVYLTFCGRVFLPKVKEILDACQHARSAVRDHLEGRAGELHVLTVRSVAAGVLPPSIVRWHDLFPETLVRLTDFSHRRSLEDAFRDGQGDVAVGPRPALVKDSDIVSLGYEELLLVSSHTSPDVSADPALLSDQDWVLFEQDHGLTEVIDAFCLAHDIKPRPVARTRQVEAALLLAVEGLGITMLPENIVPSGWRQHTRRIGAGVFRELVAYYYHGDSVAAQRYVDLLTDVDLPLVRSEDMPKGVFFL